MVIMSLKKIWEKKLKAGKRRILVEVQVWSLLASN